MPYSSLVFAGFLWGIGPGMGSAHAASVSVQPGDSLDALTSDLQPGDVITFQNGLYELEYGLDWSGVGTASSPIVLQAASGASPVLTARDGDFIGDIIDSQHMVLRGLTFEGPANPSKDNWIGGLRILSSSHIQIEDCTFRFVPGNGLQINGDVSNVRIADSVVHDIERSHAVSVGCWDASCWLQDAEFSRLLVYNVWSEDAWGMYLSAGTQNIVLQDSVIAHVAGSGLYLGSTEFGVPNLVTGNAMWDIGYDGVLIQGAVQLQNNIVANTGSEGILISESDRGALEDVVVSFNTIANTSDWGLNLQDLPSAINVVVANNVVANPLGYGLYYELPDGHDKGWSTSNHVKHNVVTGAVDGVDTDNPDQVDWVLPGGGFADFEDMDALNFYPTRTATMVDAADPSGASFVPEEDFNGVPRDGSKPDAGAYEFLNDGNPGWVLTEALKELGYSDGPGGMDVGGGCCSNDSGSKSSAWLLIPLLGFAGRRRTSSRDSAHP